jgi:[protein-PII] uridylyltransferase
MHETGILDAFIPEFGRIKDRVQFDAYHIFPVGIHSIHTVKNLKGLANENNLVLFDIMNDVKDPDLLYIAALFHDIGKISKNHAEKGAAIINAILERWGYDRKKSDDIVFLVRNHLLLVETATRRDLNDEKTVVQCSSTIGTAERAKLLYLLTWADSKATGPSAWNSWISNLIQELFLKTLHIIEMGELASPDAQTRSITARNFVMARTGGSLSGEKLNAFFDKMSPRYLLYTKPSLILLHLTMADELYELKSSGEKTPFRLHAEPDADIPGCWELSIVAPDRAGLFSEISGILALNNINILSAFIYTWLDGTAVDIFKVSSPPDPLDPNRTWEKVKSDIKHVFSGRLALDFRLGAKAGGSILAIPRRPPKPPRVFVENNSSDFFTIIEVFADDRIGLLYLITSTLSSLRLDIRIAKIATKGDQVADVFYVLDLEGQKVEDESRLREIQNALLHRLNLSHEGR